MKRASLALLSAVVVLSVDHHARGDASSPVVVAVTSADEGVPPGVAAALEISLAARGIEVREGPQASSAATLSLRSDGDGVRIVVHDAISRKTSERTVSLDGVPDDARALTVASAADGLLRASWLETATEGAPPSPPVVREVAQASLRPAPPRVFVTARGAADVATGGSVLVGGEWGVRLLVLDRGLVELRAGARSILDVRSDNGTIGGHAFTSGVSFAWSLTPREARIGLAVGPSLDVASVVFEGEASPGARGAGGAGVAVAAGLRALVTVRVAPRWRLDFAPSIGGPIRAVRAMDDGVARTGTDGVLFGLSVGPSFAP